MESSSMYLAEFVGTTLLLLLGNGINMTVSLRQSFGKGGGWMVICFGWGIAVSIAAYLTGWISGAHLNPALTIALALDGGVSWNLVPGYIVAQIFGGMFGAILAYLAYKPLIDAEKDPKIKLGVFATEPAIESKVWNVVTEAIGTAILVIGILAIGYGKNEVDIGVKPVIVGMLICVIGMSVGGATGFAINPARDLGPRIAHAILPIKDKRDSNWSYAWVPVLGSILGAVVGLIIFNLFLNFCK